MKTTHSNPNEHPTTNYLLEKKRQWSNDECELTLLERSKAAKAIISLKIKIKLLEENNNHNDNNSAPPGGLIVDSKFILAFIMHVSTIIF